MRPLEFTAADGDPCLTKGYAEKQDWKDQR